MTSAAAKSRRSRVIRYGAAALCAGLLTLYVASERWNFFAQVPLVAVEVMGGVVELHKGGVASSSITTHDWPWRHIYTFSAAGGYWEVKIPLYVPLIPLIVLTAVLWARPFAVRRVARPG